MPARHPGEGRGGIQKYPVVTNHWTPAFAGVTTFYEVVNPIVSHEGYHGCSLFDS